MKTYAPRDLCGSNLRDLITDLGEPTPHDLARFLQVTERSIFRWLAEDSAPFAVLAALWHETPHGRHVTALDVGNDRAIQSAGWQAEKAAHLATHAGLLRVLGVSDTGSANSPLYGVDWQAPPLFFGETPQARPFGFDGVGAAFFTG